MKLVARYDYREGVKIPKTGPLIVVSNHVSYMDAFALAFFLYAHGRAPRFRFSENRKFLEFRLSARFF